MYQRIKQLADDAVKLQNKDRMDAALREISAIAGEADAKEQRLGASIAAQFASATGKATAMDAEQFEAAEKAQHQAAKDQSAVLADMKAQNAVGIPVVPLKAATKKAAKK